MAGIVYKEAGSIAELIRANNHIVVVQADNPDVDSLASSLALEAILSESGKTVTLYCGIDLPSYLSYLNGWDRVVSNLPKQFDIAIIVDTSSDSLLAQLQRTGEKAWLAAKPVIIIDHHGTKPTINFAQVTCNPTAAATGEVLYELARQLKWPLNQSAKEMVAMAILSDSLGLMSESTSARTIQIIAELVAGGISLPKLDNARRQTLRRDPELIHYKGQLLQRVEFHDQNRIAVLSIPWEEIERYSPLYNPPMLVLDDMRLGLGTDLAIVFKHYKDGKLTAKIRANFGKPIADKLAESFGGGGHPLAAGFKLEGKVDAEQIKADVIKSAGQLLDGLRAG
ncbi:DHH family phosphoesterase [Candidatus Saccharibacteria bacterium]|nr:DHH family phosphoesterase [Candidatus Saccharibacteria bacterium]